MWDFSRLKARVRSLRCFKWLENSDMTWFYRSDSDLGGFLIVNATRIWDRKYEFDGQWNARRWWVPISYEWQVWILDGGARLEIEKYWPLTANYWTARSREHSRIKIAFVNTNLTMLLVIYLFLRSMLLVIDKATSIAFIERSAQNCHDPFRLLLCHSQIITWLFRSVSVVTVTSNF